MSQSSQTASSDLQSIALLLLLAYVMSSAPRYIRQLRETRNDIKIENVSPLRQVLKAGRVYTIDPYVKVWEKLRPSLKVWTQQIPGSTDSEVIKPQISPIKTSI